MKKIVAALALVALSGCSALGDGFTFVKDAVKAPPAEILSSFNTLVDFALDVLLQAALIVFGPYVGPILQFLGL